MRAFVNLRRRALLACATLSVGASALLPASVRATTPPTTFSLTIGASCISGYSVADTNIHIVWRNAGGALKTSVDVLSGSDGYWVTCPSADLFVTSGDTINAGDGTYTRHYVVPYLSVKVDRVQSTGDWVNLIFGVP